MPFPLSYKGKIEAWIGADGLDRTNYQNMFVGKLSDELRGMGRGDVYVLENKGTLDKGAPQYFFPHGNVVTFGLVTTTHYAKFGELGLGGLVGGEVEVELKDEMLIVSYYLSHKPNTIIWSLVTLVLLGCWIATIGSPISVWTFPVIISFVWLFFVLFPYVYDLVVFRKLIKNIVKSVRDDMALNNSLSTSGF